MLTFLCLEIFQGVKIGTIINFTIREYSEKMLIEKKVTIYFYLIKFNVGNQL